MANNKGVGMDDIPSDLLKRGGTALAACASVIGKRIVDEECWSISFKGGRLVSLYKGKGARYCCDNSRGLTLIDHFAKAFICDLKSHVEEKYCKAMPPSQHGAVAGGGTDLAHHFLLLCMDLARSAQMSLFVLFLDSIKAFDKAIREIVFGYPFTRGLGPSMAITPKSSTSKSS